MTAPDEEKSAFAKLAVLMVTAFIDMLGMLMVLPLLPFYETAPAGQRLVRLCFAKNDATMDAAIELLRLL